MKNLTLEEAIKAGYKIKRPDKAPKQLRELCEDLGPNYHLAATVELSNGIKDSVVHRVVGSGYDIEIYRHPGRSGRFIIVLWEGYGSHSIAELRDVSFGSVGDRVMELVATWCPPDVCKEFWDN